MMPYAADDLGRPIFFVSSMAMHTQNLRQDPRASLLITQPDVSGDPLGAARLTLAGRREGSTRWQKSKNSIFHATRTQSSGRTTPTLRIIGWKFRRFTSSEDSASWDGSPLRTMETRYRILWRRPRPEIIRHMNEDHADALRLIAHRVRWGSPRRGGYQLQSTGWASISGSSRATGFTASVWLSARSEEYRRRPSGLR